MSLSLEYTGKEFLLTLSCDRKAGHRLFRDGKQTFRGPLITKLLSESAKLGWLWRPHLPEEHLCPKCSGKGEKHVGDRKDRTAAS